MSANCLRTASTGLISCSLLRQPQARTVLGSLFVSDGSRADSLVTIRDVPVQRAGRQHANFAAQGRAHLHQRNLQQLLARLTAARMHGCIVRQQARIYREVCSDGL